MRFEGTTAHPKHREESSRLNQRGKEEEEQSGESEFTSSVHDKKNCGDYRDGRSR